MCTRLAGSFTIVFAVMLNYWLLFRVVEAIPYTGEYMNGLLHTNM